MQLRATIFTAVLVAAIATSYAIGPALYQSVTGDDGPNIIIHVRALDDTTPGSSEDCGIVNIYVIDVDQMASLKDAYIAEDNANVWAHWDATPALGESLEGNVPYNDAFAIAVYTQYNYTVAYNVSEPGWDETYVNATLSSSDLYGIDTATEMSESTAFFNVTGSTDSDTAGINFYLDNSTSGWSIAHGETVTCTITVKGYY